MKGAAVFAAAHYSFPWEMAARAIFGLAALIVPMIVTWLIIRRQSAIA
jgi:hypothetical protein